MIKMLSGYTACKESTELASPGEMRCAFPGFPYFMRRTSFTDAFRATVKVPFGTPARKLPKKVQYSQVYHEHKARYGKNAT